MKNILIYKLFIKGFAVAILNDIYKIPHENIGIISNEATGAFTNIAFVSGRRQAIIGNHFEKSVSSHILRIPWSESSVIQGNILRSASLEGGDRHVLKLHGPKESWLSSTSDFSRTNHLLIANNIFGSAGPWPVTICPQNAESDERIENVILEQNRFETQNGELGKNIKTQISLLLSAKHVTLRNNLFIGTGSNNGYTSLHLGQRGIEPASDNIFIYHNNVFKKDADSSGIALMKLADKNHFSKSNIKVFNNILFGSQSSSKALESQIISANNLIGVDPKWLNPNDSPNGFKLGKNSPALGTGLSLPVFENFFGQSLLLKTKRNIGME